jgi:Zn-finger nucleic acid-binding protein
MILTVADRCSGVWSGDAMILTVADRCTGVWSDGAMILTVADRCSGVWSDGAMILTVADRCTRPQISYGMASDRTRNDIQATDRFRHDKTSCNGKILAYHIASLILSPT